MAEQLLDERRIPSNGSDETFDNMDDDNDMDEVEDEMVTFSTRTRRRLHKPFHSQQHHLVSENEDPDDDSEEEDEDEEDEEDEDEEDRDDGVDDDEDFVMLESDVEEDIREDDEERGEEESFNDDKGSLRIFRQAPRVSKREAERPALPSTERQSDDDSAEDDDDIPLSKRIGRIQPAASTKQEPRLQQKREPTLVQVKHEKKPLSSGMGIDSDASDDIPIAVLGRCMRDVAKRRRAPLSRARASRPTSSGSIVKQKQKRNAKSLHESSSRTQGIVKKRTRGVKKEQEVQNGKFEKPGQRRETPPANDPLRLFYHSMYREKVEKGVRSALAEDWMLKHGLLEEDEARRILRDVGKRKKGA